MDYANRHPRLTVDVPVEVALDGGAVRLEFHDDPDSPPLDLDADDVGLLVATGTVSAPAPHGPGTSEFATVTYPDTLVVTVHGTQLPVDEVHARLTAGLVAVIRQYLDAR